VFSITATPKKVPGVYYDSESARLSWEEPFNNFDSITQYNVTCYTGDGAALCSGCDVKGERRYCDISDFLPTKNYAFHVKAKNSIGIGEPGVYHYKAGFAYLYVILWPKDTVQYKIVLNLANFSCPII